MHLQQSPTSTAERPDARNRSETRLSGRWLILARAVWLALVIPSLGLFVVGLPV